MKKQQDIEPQKTSPRNFSAEDLLVKCLNWDQKGLRWAMLSVIPSERALWRRLDEELGVLRWRLMFSELGDQMLCSLSHGFVHLSLVGLGSLH